MPRTRTKKPPVLTLRSLLAFVIANPGIAPFVEMAAHFGIEPRDYDDDASYFDIEGTFCTLLNELEERGYVTHVVTPRDGWKYTATGKEWT